MRIVLDTAIPVRATEASTGPARLLLLEIVTRPHTLILSNEILFEVAKVLRYPRASSRFGLSENGTIWLLREAHNRWRSIPSYR